jgi:hypothetical protein
MILNVLAPLTEELTHTQISLTPERYDEHVRVAGYYIWLGRTTSSHTNEHVEHTAKADWQLAETYPLEQPRG